MNYRLDYTTKRDNSREKSIELSVDEMNASRERLLSGDLSNKAIAQNIFGNYLFLFKEGLVKTDSPSKLSLYSPRKETLHTLADILKIPYSVTEVKKITN